VRLRAVLRAQPEQHDAARVHVDRDDRGAAGHQFLALQPSRGDDVGVGIARHDARLLRREPFDQREERAVDVETVGRRGDAVAERMLAVDLEPENGAGREVLIARQPFLQSCAPGSAASRSPGRTRCPS
jgi:hypothetical protein